LRLLCGSARERPRARTAQERSCAH
jgi:hypothetical protein